MVIEMGFMDAKLIARGIVDGLTSLSEGFYLSAIRTVEGSGVLGHDLKRRNEYETERFIRAFRALISNDQPIRQLITIVSTDFYAKLDDKGKKAINDRIGYSDAKLGTRTGLSFAGILTLPSVSSIVWRSKANASPLVANSLCTRRPLRPAR